MNRTIDLSGIPTPQLLEIRKILTTGVPASAEEVKPKETIAAGGSQLCHKSPPKGYPKEKSEYGDPACYRYPLNTEARCLAAWRYVHQKQNWAILGNKASTIEGHIKSYGKKHYNLDLKTGESEVVDWEKLFLEYYDSETMGERAESIELEPEEVAQKVEEKVEDKKIETLGTEVKTQTAELASKSSQVETLTTEITGMKTELESLRKFKKDTEDAANKAKKIQSIKSKLDEAGIEADVNTEADYWLGMSDDVLTKTIAKMSEMIKKGTQASASKEIKVPPVNSATPSDNKAVVAEGLKEHKQAKNKK